MEKWKISHNNYLADRINPRLRLAFWEGHRDFAYDLVNYIKPKRLVELGSQYGCSLFAFCQCVLDNGLDTKIDAVDYWSGDIGAEDTGEEVFRLVQQIKEMYFNDISVRLHPMGFQDAVNLFEDHSIQMLHIDGGHTFQEVDNDFNTWLPKLEQDGLVLFHDIYSTIDDGSCRHWEYIKTKYDAWYEFKHSCGLGILFPKGDFWYRKMEETDFRERCQDIYYYRALYEYRQIRYRELCGNYEKRYEAICEQSRMIAERDQENEELTNLVEEKDAAVKAMESLVKEKDEAVKAMELLVKEKDTAVKAQNRMIRKKDQEKQALTNLVKEKDAAVETMERLVKEKDTAMEKMERLVQEKDAAMEHAERLVREKDEAMEKMERLVQEKDAAVEAMERLVQEKDAAVEAESRMIGEKEKEIAALTSLVKEKDEAVEAMECLVRDKDLAIEVESEMIRERDRTILDMERMLTEEKKKSS